MLGFLFKLKLLKNWQLIIYQNFIFRLFFVLILNIIYYIYHWTFLINLLGNILAFLYQNILGLNTTFAFPDFTGDLQGVTHLSKACVYIEMYAYILPFLIDTKKSILKNIIVIISTLTIIQIINIFRIFISVWWRISFDVPRWLYHDLPDTLIWYPICIGIMIYGSFKFHPISAKIEKIDKKKKES